MGMEGSHSQAAGMGGLRTAGDLVARMQMTKRMRIKEAKDYVAGKLGCGVRDLSDPIAMETIRLEKGLGTLAFTSNVHPGRPRHDRGQVQHLQGARHPHQQCGALQGAGGAVGVASLAGSSWGGGAQARVAAPPLSRGLTRVSPTFLTAV